MLYGYVGDPNTWVDVFGLAGNGSCNPAKTREAGNGKWRNEKGQYASDPGWPDNFGFKSRKDSIGTLMPRKKIDRYGHPGGEFVADVGTPFNQRALLDSFKAKEFHTYEVVKPINNIRTGPTTPWFGQPGRRWCSASITVLSQ
jgi:hypothetical protein